jgi:hypothetical protein
LLAKQTETLDVVDTQMAEVKKAGALATTAATTAKATTTTRS